MKRILYAVVVLLFLSAMLLPVIGSFNNSTVHISPASNLFRADGSPLPPLPPASLLVAADGSPLPPLPPRSTPPLAAA